MPPHFAPEEILMSRFDCRTGRGTRLIVTPHARPELGIGGQADFVWVWRCFWVSLLIGALTVDFGITDQSVMGDP